MYESRAYDTEHGDPVVVLVVTGTHDVSRLVHVMAGGPAVVEQLQAAEKVRSQVARHNGGQAAIKLLAAHGGADFTGETWPTREELAAAKEAAAGAVAAARTLGKQHREEVRRLRERLDAAELVCHGYGSMGVSTATDRQKATYELWAAWRQLTDPDSTESRTVLPDERIADLARQRDAKRDAALARLDGLLVVEVPDADNA